VVTNPKPVGFRGIRAPAFAFAVGLACAGAHPVAAQTSYEIAPYVIAGGGGHAVGGSYVVTATIGQAAAGSQSLLGGAYVLRIGFWATAAPPCGNGQLDGGEECDDGNLVGGDCCDATCRREPDDASCSDGNLCTEDDVCRAGTCSGDAIQCVAIDACHLAGLCNPSTGLCSNPVAPPDTSCEEQSKCTLGDKCDGAGNCLLGAPKSCPVSDACAGAGACNPFTGACDFQQLPENSPCDDHNGCTHPDICNGGHCVSGELTVCAETQCRLAPSCNPATGLCPAGGEPKANTTRCSDFDECTVGDQCNDGVCISGARKSCDPVDQCHNGGACSPGTGLCVNPLPTQGADCASDGVPGKCDAAGVCVPSGSVCGTLAEECSGGECCTEGCVLRGETEPCGGQPPACHEQRLCNGREATCPPEPRPVGNDTLCHADDDPCTDDDHCTNGQCVVGARVCAADAKALKDGVVRRGIPKVKIRVICESDERGDCDATALTGASSVVNGSDGSGQLASEDEPIVEPGTRPLKRVESPKKGGLKFRTVIKLKLNQRGQALLSTGDVPVKVEATVHRASKDIRPKVIDLILHQRKGS